MKMNIDNIFKSAFALAAFVLVSCTQVEVEMNEATGYLCAPSLDVDVTVEDLMGTKAVDFLVETPDYADVHFLVKDKDGVVKHDRKGLWEKMLMPVGKYSIKATCGSNGFGAPYFTAETAEDAAIEPYEDEKPALTLGLGNALMKITVPSDFAAHFTLGTVTFSASGFDPVVLTAAQIADWYYVPSEVAISVTIKGTSSAGVDKVFEYGNITLAQKSARTIVCGDKPGSMPSIALPDQTAGAWAGRLYVTPATFTNVSAANQAKVVYEVSESGNWDDIKTSMAIDGQDTPGLYHVVKGLENGKTYHVRARVGNLYTSDDQIKTITVAENLPGADVTFSHNYPGNVLTSSTAKLSLNLGTGILSILQSKGLMLISSSLAKGSDEVRTLDGISGEMNPSADWPYLPKGDDYKLTVSHWVKNDASDKDTYVKTGLSHNVNPTFTVNLNKSYCSYDDYKGTNDRSPNPTAANDLTNGRTAESIYNVGASWTISDDIMKKTHYAKEVVVLLDGKETSFKVTPTSNSYSPGTLTGNSWDQHKVTTKVTFDGVPVTPTERVHEITGLPYSALPTKGGGWTEEQEASHGLETFSWGNTEFYMYDDATMGTNLQIATPSFNVPADFQVDMTFSAHGYFKAGITSWSDTKKDVKATIYDGQDSYSFTAEHNKNVYKDYPVNNLSLRSSYKKIRIENSAHSNSNRLFINNVTIHYK